MKLMNGPAVSDWKEGVQALAVVAGRASICLCVWRGSQGAGCACELGVCAHFLSLLKQGLRLDLALLDSF